MSIQSLQQPTCIYLNYDRLPQSLSLFCNEMMPIVIVDDPVLHFAELSLFEYPTTYRCVFSENTIGAGEVVFPSKSNQMIIKDISNPFLENIFKDGSLTPNGQF